MGIQLDYTSPTWYDIGSVSTLEIYLPNCHFKCGNDYIWKPAWSSLSYLISKQIYRRTLLVGQATTGDPSITTGWGLDKGHLLFCGLLPAAKWTKWTNLDAAQQLDIPRTYDHICANSYLHTSLLTVFKAQWCYRMGGTLGTPHPPDPPDYFLLNHYSCRSISEINLVPGLRLGLF